MSTAYLRTTVTSLSIAASAGDKAELEKTLHAKPRERRPRRQKPKKADLFATAKALCTAAFASGKSVEEVRRELAVWSMVVESANRPNGSRVIPPAIYRRDADHPGRPVAWKKDDVTGAVRPRRMMDDMVRNMSRETRAEYVEKRRHMMKGSKARHLRTAREVAEG